MDHNTLWSSPHKCHSASTSSTEFNLNGATMKKFRYVVVCSNGSSYDLMREGSFYPHGLGATTYYDLPELLRKGWQPVRETAMGGPGDTTVAYSLVVLEREMTTSEA
jgi:hypothetical protein